MKNLLPPFPVDDVTIDMLSAALDPRAAGDKDAKGSSVEDFLTMMSRLGGSDTDAVDAVVDGIHIMRDQHYHVYSVLMALIEEIRRLREAAGIAALIDEGPDHG